jgi:hypothetical protein
VSPITLTAKASSGLQVSYSVTGPAQVSGATLIITGAGLVNVTAAQAGNGKYSAATPVSQSFTAGKALLTVTANNAQRAVGAPNPAFTYTITGFVNGDTTSVVSGGATETTTATSTSPPGPYPITFATENLSAANYTFTYLSGTLTVGGSGVPTTAVQLIVKSTGFCLDVAGESTTPGTNTIQNTCNGSSGQQWTATAIGDGSYELTVKLDGYSLDVTGKSTVSGTAVIEWPYDGGSNEHWIFKTTSDGYYNIVNQNSNLCLDIIGGAGAGAKAQVDQNTCSSSSGSQKWSLTPHS